MYRKTEAPRSVAAPGAPQSSDDGRTTRKRGRLIMPQRPQGINDTEHTIEAWFLDFLYPIPNMVSG